MHVHPDIAIDIARREHRAVVTPRRNAGGAVPPNRPAGRARVGTAVVRLGARLGRLDVIVVAGHRGWRARTVAA